MKKRILSIILAVCMVVVMIPAAFAVQAEMPTGLAWVTEPGQLQKDFTDKGSYMDDIFPGDVKWNRVENGSNEYEVVIYHDGTKVDETVWFFDATDISPILSVDVFRIEPRESGTYTFTVKALGNDQDITDSEIATSAAYEYQRPAAQLETPTNLRWDGATAYWDAVDGADSYLITWYYAESANGEWIEAGSTRGLQATNIPLEDWILTDHGEGYYAFAIRALSDRVLDICPSELSARSAIYSTDGATVSVSESLDQILGNIDNSSMTVDDAVEAVKELDTEELRVAMEADSSSDGVNSKIDALEEKTGITVSTSVGADVDIDGTKVSLTGAALNADADTDSVTFHITKPSQDAVVPGTYANAVQFDFQLNGAAQEANGEFAVPIKIKMPIPAGITPEKLRILHYTVNGQLEEVIFPSITQENDIYYATFVVTHFSPFVFAEATTAAMIGETPYYSLQAAIDAADSGARIDLYRNSDDTTLKVADKDLEIYCGVYSLAQDVQWTLVGCEMTETTDSDGNTVIKITRTGGSSGGGGSTGGGGGGGVAVSKPSASVSGTGGKVAVGNDGTVTITPDEGYQIAQITVNGEAVAIPADGKLTGLDANDTVVVTFEEAAAALPFADVANDAWYADAVQYVYEKGMMNGTSATMFQPDATTTRGMIVTMLYRLEGEPDATASSFADVAADEWYADAVGWAAANGVVNGVSETAFAPDDPITREQMAAILYRYAEEKGYDVTAGGMALNEYTDAAQISAYAQTAMQWANAEGLITGNTATTLNPQGEATRAEVATILMRFVENIA